MTRAQLSKLRPGNKVIRTIETPASLMSGIKLNQVYTISGIILPTTLFVRGHTKPFNCMNFEVVKEIKSHLPDFL